MSLLGTDEQPDGPLLPPASHVWTQRRIELLGWFRQQAPSVAAAYEGAVELLGNTAFPGRVHFIAHTVRDIADRLVFCLDDQLKGNRVQYEQKLDQIEKQWHFPDHPFETAAKMSITDPVPVSATVARWIDQLVTEHRERRRRPNQYALLFRWLMRNDPSRAIVNERTVKSFKETREWFMARTHLRSSAPPRVDERELYSRFEVFEKMLHSFVGDFFTGTNELDAILQQANQ